MALTEKKAFALAKRKGKDNKEAAILAGCPEKLHLRQVRV